MRVARLLCVAAWCRPCHGCRAHCDLHINYMAMCAVSAAACVARMCLERLSRVLGLLCVLWRGVGLAVAATRTVGCISIMWMCVVSAVACVARMCLEKPVVCVVTCCAALPLPPRAAIQVFKCRFSWMISLLCRLVCSRLGWGS